MGSASLTAFSRPGRYRFAAKRPAFKAGMDSSLHVGKLLWEAWDGPAAVMVTIDGELGDGLMKNGA
jgi:hypothetical protein